MAQIGAFTLKDDVWSGTIRAVTINVKARMVPNRDKDENTDAPEFGIHAGEAELGAAWHQASKECEKPFLGVRIDDPGFAQTLRAAFFENEKIGTGVLLWNRPR